MQWALECMQNNGMSSVIGALSVDKNKPAKEEFPLNGKKIKFYNRTLCELRASVLFIVVCASCTYKEHNAPPNVVIDES